MERCAGCVIAGQAPSRVRKGIMEGHAARGGLVPRKKGWVILKPSPATGGTSATPQDKRWSL